MYYILGSWGGVRMAGNAPRQFETEEEAERWADANMTSWQVMEGTLGPHDVYLRQDARDRTRPAEP